MRCQWCGNANPATATECAFCHKDILHEQTQQDAVDVLEGLDTSEPAVACPNCGGSNFLGTEYCYLCNTRLHPGLPRVSGSKTAAVEGYLDETAKFQLGLMKYVPFATVVVAVLIFIAAFSAIDRSARQPQVSPTPPLEVVSREVPAAPGAPGSPTEVVEERVEDEPSSALQEYRKKQREEAKKAAEKAAKSGGKGDKAAEQALAAAPTATAYQSGHYVLPLPSAGRFHSDQHKTGKTYVTGTTYYSIAAPVGQAFKTYELVALFKACYAQGLLPRSAMTGYKGERADGNVVSYEVNVEAEGDSKVSIQLRLSPDQKNPTSATSVVVSYKLRKGQSVRLRREGL